jgi:regulator of telomere elongation helicase 1
MPKLIVEGIEVHFPRDPYPCQISYMEHNIRALLRSSNAVLESPTGTGKTLCLLCSALAWQHHALRTVQARNHMASNLDSNTPNASVGVIIYASRTHSQLAQVVSELKTTAYQPRMTVLGSREQLCVNEKVARLKGNLMKHACNSLNVSRGCAYKNNLDSFSGSKDSGSANRPIQDIEDLLSVGIKERICPYFHSRDLSSNSELVLLPYNYLLESSIRSTLKINWQNSVVIFDEAHNLERVASDAASFSISSSDIAAWIAEMQQVLKLLQDSVFVPSKLSQQKDDDLGGDMDAGDRLKRPDPASAVKILKLLFELENLVNNVPLTRSGPGPNPCIVYPGAWLSQSFESIGFLRLEARRTVVDIQRCSNFLLDEQQNALGGFESAGNSSLTTSEPKLQQFAVVIDRLFRVDRSCLIDYKVFIEEEPVVSKHNSKSYASTGEVLGFNHRGNSGSKTKRVVNYWAFTPGIAMEELKSLGVRSIILTSGTLFPIESLKEDMKLPFPIQLENPHVITDEQIMITAVSTGPSGKKLNSSFQNRDSFEYKDELGSSILALIETMAGRAAAATALISSGSTKVLPSIPAGRELRGGVLVFFPSYAAMTNVVDSWIETGMYDRLRARVGAIIAEPKGGGANSTAGAAGRRLQQQQEKKGDTSRSVPNESFMLSSSKSISTDKLKSEDTSDDAVVKGKCQSI